MIFSKHKKQGAEVGRAIKKTLLKGVGTGFGQEKDALPTAAIHDPYIAGFIIYFSVMSIDMVFKGAFWKNKKRMEFLVECWREIGVAREDINEFLEVMGNPTKEEIWDKCGQYSKGKNAAALVLTSAYGVLNRNELQVLLGNKKNSTRLNCTDKIRMYRIYDILVEQTIFRFIYIEK